MPRLRQVSTGAVASVADDLVSALGSDWVPVGDQATGYAGFTVAELRGRIESRNEGREEADRLSIEGKKADLVTALEADDSK